MKNFEMGRGPEESKEFGELSNLMGGKDRIEGMSDRGEVYIHKRPNGSIEVSVAGKDGINTQFTASEGMSVEAKAMTRDQNRRIVSPELSLSDVLATFRQKAEKSAA